ncbi:MAG TPA: HD domain-containing protein, partial [Aggregatilineales bacterium]|nr:HD domain-containing protein [Aggregatilineales bacterium]
MTQDLVDQLYTDFHNTCRTYLSDETCNRLHGVYEFAREAHGDQTRKSGEPLITHPIAVAHHLAKLYLDESVLTGALLHDVAEDTHVTLSDIEARFGEHTRLLVDGVTHLKNVSQLEDIAHLFLAMSGDVRVVLIKLYDRLHNLQTLHIMPSEQRRRKAIDTLRVYVPLATKLGIWQLKTQFESLILYETDPETYELICDGIDQRYREHHPYLQKTAHDLQKLLREHDLPAGIRIKRRSPYRIYERMSNHKLDDEAFNGAFQIILLVDSLPECYLALGHIHSCYPHTPGSLSDSIGNPRDVFYRSLNTTIIVPGYDSAVNVGIRTYDFDRLADIGILAQIQFAAAHEERQPEDAPWLPELSRLYHESENPQKFVESVFQDILQKHLQCFTPRGDEFSLPRGATVIDFAYLVHTQIGHECRGAIVNGKLVDSRYQLQDGDHVQIIRARHGGPYHEWLDETLEYVTTSRAKRKIREWFR